MLGGRFDKWLAVAVNANCCKALFDTHPSNGRMLTDMKIRLAHTITGFTLIESLLSLSLMAILIGVAWPGFEAHWQISRRQDAQNTLLQLHLKQLQWRASHAQYANSLASLAWTSSNSIGGHYSLILKNADAQSYELHATAMGLQARDTPCAHMSLYVSANTQLLRTSQNMPSTDPGQCWRW